MNSKSWQFDIFILNCIAVIEQVFSYITIVTQSSIVNQVYLICADLNKLQEVQP